MSMIKWYGPQHQGLQVTMLLAVSVASLQCSCSIQLQHAQLPAKALWLHFCACYKCIQVFRDDMSGKLSASDYCRMWHVLRYMLWSND